MKLPNTDNMKNGERLAYDIACVTEGRIAVDDLNIPTNAPAWAVAWLADNVEHGDTVTIAGQTGTVVVADVYYVEVEHSRDWHGVLRVDEFGTFYAKHSA